jgi:hypothetical protein
MTIVGNIVNLARRVIDALGLDLDTGFQRVEYDDIFPGSVWEVPAGASAPDIENVTIAGLPLRMRAFSGTLTETMSNSWEIIHGIAIDALNAGTIKLEGHVHGSPSTTGAGTAVFQITAILRPVNNGPAVTMGTVRCVFTIAANQQYYSKIAGGEFTVPAIGYQIGDLINFNVFRNPADPEDNYGSDFLFDQCALHAPFDSRGSRQRYVK